MKKLFSTKYSDNGISFAMLIMRLVFGGLMIPNGYQKLTHFASMSKQFPAYFGLSNSLWLGLLIFAEFFCAILVLGGFMTRLACIPLIIAMAVALFSANHGDVFSEYGGKATMFLAAYIAILFAGPGKVSLDRLIGK